jgi:hypothetical protein
MFMDMFNAMDTGRTPMETFYDGYVVNAIIDACYRAAGSKRWEAVKLEDWRGGEVHVEAGGMKAYDANHFLIKEETMPDGTRKVILKDKGTGEISQVILPA